MSKITLKVEINEETYKQIKGDSVCSNNNECIISKSSSAYYALNAIINATPITECDDCVSRQAVNDLYDRYHPRLATRVYEFGEELKALPSVLPKHEQSEWISVSERLPEKNVWVLVTVEQNDKRYQEIMRRHNYIEAWTDNIDIYTDEITAWMPLPELYRESEVKI